MLPLHSHYQDNSQAHWACSSHLENKRFRMSPVFNLNEAGTYLLLWRVNKWPIPNQGRKVISPFSWGCVCVCMTSLKSALQAVWRGPIPKHNHTPQACTSYKASVLTVDACPQIHTHVCSSQVLKEWQARCNTSASTQQKIMQTPLLPLFKPNWERW